jgi:uncharacterized protein YjdB
MFVLITALFTESDHVLAASPKLNQTSATLWIGDTLQLKVKNTKQKVKWSSGKKSVATVSAKGKIKAKKAGKTIITAKIGKKKYKCRVTVRKTQLSSTKLTVDYGKSVPLTLEYPKKKVAWFSSDKQVVYADGKRVYAKAVGDAVITAKCDGKSYSCKVKVLSGETEKLAENGIYTSKEKVASYIHTYQKLPDNFITKDEAKKLGWEGGSLLSCAPYKCIGGDKYLNYEKTLPVKTDRIYYECDINTLGALTRGAERLIYSNDGLIYYTSDHYATFTKLY